MQEQAVKLAQAVSVFKLHDSGQMDCLPMSDAVGVAPQLAAPATRMPAVVKDTSAAHMTTSALTSHGGDWEET
jgi:hypothetical protein